MGYLRSCYSTEARFFNDSDVTYPITWYWADPSAPRFLSLSSFAPLSLSQGESGRNHTVGEVVGAPRPWRNGSIPVATPTGVLDGDPRWFADGQSVSDPGIARTVFGIPSDCTAGYPLTCTGGVLAHYSWQLEQPLGVPIGQFLFFGVDVSALHFAPPPWDGFLTCTIEPGPPVYTGLIFEGTDSHGVVHIWYLSGFVGPGPVYGLSLIPGVPDPMTDVFIRFQPGP